MEWLSSKERLLKTLLGEPIDRIATFDIIHNIKLIEYLTRERLTPQNAEDLLCRATGEVLDLIRHFSIPDKTDPWFIRDENGFVYRYEWWTAHLIERPNFGSTKEIENIVKRDIKLIKSDIEKKKVCRIARQHVRLFDENYEYIEEVKEDYKRITKKLDGPLMLPPEDVSPIGIATERYDEANWWYFYTDYPETARLYLDTLTDYQLCFIDAFACAEVCPLTQISVPIGTGNGLLYSPKFNREEILPRERKKIERWKKHGYYVMAFLDGYKWPLIDDYIKAGVSEIHPLEPYCQMDVKTFRQKYPEMAMGQPIDCTQLLPFGTPQEIRDTVVKAIEDADRKKVFIGSTSEIHPEVKVENAVTMYRTARNYKL
jgi:uroporphyrinogen decarboxylase